MQDKIPLIDQSISNMREYPVRSKLVSEEIVAQNLEKIAARANAISDTLFQNTPADITIANDLISNLAASLPEVLDTFLSNLEAIGQLTHGERESHMMRNYSSLLKGLMQKEEIAHLGEYLRATEGMETDDKAQRLRDIRQVLAMSTASRPRLEYIDETLAGNKGATRASLGKIVDAFLEIDRKLAAGAENEFSAKEFWREMLHMRGDEALKLRAIKALVENPHQELPASHDDVSRWLIAVTTARTDRTKE